MHTVRPVSGAKAFVFFAERQALKVPDLDPEAHARDISRVGIIGAGTMGGAALPWPSPMLVFR